MSILSFIGKHGAQKTDTGKPDESDLFSRQTEQDPPLIDNTSKVLSTQPAPTTDLSDVQNDAVSAHRCMRTDKQTDLPINSSMITVQQDMKKTDNDEGVVEDSENLEGICAKLMNHMDISETPDNETEKPDDNASIIVSKHVTGNVTEANGRYFLGEWNKLDDQIPYAVDSDGGAYFHRYDLVANYAKMDTLFVFGTSSRGEEHYAFKFPRQDSFVIKHHIGKNNRNYIIAIIADGVSSAIYADQLSDYISNYSANILDKYLNENQNLDSIDWNEVSEHIWKASLKYCKELSDPADAESFLEKWATTLEFIIIESNNAESNRFVHVTVSGDGAAYLIDNAGNWHNIKRGKMHEDHMISNGVDALPAKPESIVVKQGLLNRNNAILLVTDGIGDILEKNEEVRTFFADKLMGVNNLIEFARIINAGIEQMGDDRTAVLIKYYDRT